MSKIFVRERRRFGAGSGQPRFRIVAAMQTDLRVYAEHLRREELEQIAQATGAEVVYLTRGDGSGGEPEAGQGQGQGQGRGGRHGGEHRRRQMQGD
ncbi:MAG TPA: hypothetical protein VGA61_06860 [Anaerolineae bacterium]